MPHDQLTEGLAAGITSFLDTATKIKQQKQQRQQKVSDQLKAFRLKTALELASKLKNQDLLSAALGFVQSGDPEQLYKFDPGAVSEDVFSQIQRKRQEEERQKYLQTLLRGGQYDAARKLAQQFGLAGAEKIKPRVQDLALAAERQQRALTLKAQHDLYRMRIEALKKKMDDLHNQTIVDAGTGALSPKLVKQRIGEINQMDLFWQRQEKDILDQKKELVGDGTDVSVLLQEGAIDPQTADMVRQLDQDLAEIRKARNMLRQMSRILLNVNADRMGITEIPDAFKRKAEEYLIYRGYPADPKNIEALFRNPKTRQAIDRIQIIEEPYAR